MYFPIRIFQNGHDTRGEIGTDLLGVGASWIGTDRQVRGTEDLCLGLGGHLKHLLDNDDDRFAQL
jgi:hypothetical protein